MDEYIIQILVVEDEEAHAELVRRTFTTQAGRFQLTVVTSIAAARAHLSAAASEGRPPDLILADLLLPDGQGIDLLPTGEETPSFPLVVMTSHGNEQVAVEAMKAGALDYIVKSALTLIDLPRVTERALREWAHITERRRAEAALRQAEAKYRSIFENAVEGIFQNTHAGQFLSVNPALARMLGYASPADLLTHITNIGQQLYVDPTRLAEVQGLLRRQKVVRDFEAQLRCKDGRQIWTSINARVVRDAGGAVLYYEGTIEDITARKQAEEALQQEAQISAALARVGHELIAALEGPELLDRLCQLTAEVVGCDCCHAFLWQPERDECVPVARYGDTPEQWETLRVATMPYAVAIELTACLEREQTLQVATAAHPGLLPAALQKAGVTAALWVALRRGAELIGGLSVGYRGRTTPFTPQQERIACGIGQLAPLALEDARLMEELRRANRLKNDFLATMSHELRTPLNIVIGYTDLLLAEDLGALTAEQLDSLQRVRKAADEELKLVTTMLDLSRLEAGRFSLDRREVQLPDLLHEVTGETREWLRKKPGVQLIWQVAPTLPVLYTDPTKLKIVLKNLVENAVKFTDAGTVTVTVQLRAEGVEFAVADTGIGIAPEIQVVMFEMFRQGDSAMTRRYGGVGLGLYIVKRMVEVLSGALTVESAVGKGSTFSVWLPYCSGAGVPGEGQLLSTAMNSL